MQYNSGGGESLNGYNDYIYTYGGVPTSGYTQDPFWGGGRMRALGFYVDDTIRMGRLTLNLGVRYDYSKGYFNSFPHPRSQRERDRHVAGRRQAVRLERDLAAPGRDDEAERGRLDAAEGQLGPLLPRHHHRRVRQRDAVDCAQVRVLRASTTPQGNPLGTEVVTDNSNLRIDSGFENPYTDQFILTLEHQFNDRLGLSVSGVYKNSSNQSGWKDVGGTYADVARTIEGKDFTLKQLTSGADSRIFQLTNPGDISNDYKGFNVQLNKRMSNRWQATIGLTMSKSEGIQASSNARSSADDIADQRRQPGLRPEPERLRQR